MVVETDGSVAAEDAVAYAARIFQDQLSLFVNFDEPKKIETKPQIVEPEFNKNLLKKVDLKYKWHVRGDFNQIEFNRVFKKILLANKPDLVITAGAGSVYNLIPKLKQFLA